VITNNKNFKQQKGAHYIQEHHHRRLCINKKVNEKIGSNCKAPGNKRWIRLSIDQNKITPERNRKNQKESNDQCQSVKEIY
jgi:hypothetical protein